MALDIGRIGIWTFALDGQPPAKSQEYAAEIEELGYGAIWLPEAVGREAFTNSALILAGTKKITVATGIANIWGRDPVTAGQAHRTLESAYPGRFLLGLGVSHQPIVEGMRGHEYKRPLAAMKDYLERMDNAIFMAYQPEQPPQRVLAALGPKMLRLAAEKAAGAHPYFVPPEHTRVAREMLGEGPLLAPEQAVVLETDPEKARAIARQHMSIYVPRTVNYANNLKRLGWTDDDMANGSSDKLVDAIVAWGDEDAIVSRVKAHLDSGADHVCIQVLTADRNEVPMKEWRALAPALLSL
jgi:probable F420-dependent oxidoreductase